MEHLNETVLDGNVTFFIAAGMFSGLAGVAALLRSNDPIAWKRGVGAFLNSGLLGLGISLVWHSQFKENVYALLGICIIFGLGGNILVEWVIDNVKRGGQMINFGPNGLTTKVNGAAEEKKNEG